MKDDSLRQGPDTPSPDPLRQPIIDTVWQEKYRHTPDGGGFLEATADHTLIRVCAGVFGLSPDRLAALWDSADPAKGRIETDPVGSPIETDALETLQAMLAREWCPGGRILAGAGTARRVTLINCFVNMTVPDSLDGIMAALTRAALTMQQGGGIGTDFSTLRPKGSVVRRTGSVASGPLSFMDLWDTMCATIMSGGSRRGAMMATLACDHPDIIDFVQSKTTAGRLTNFNISVLISDAFMEAVTADAPWDLGFSIPPSDADPIAETTRNGAPWYVYRRVDARTLWDLITKTTFEHAEPGVIFIDRVNQTNNLAYCEDIRATNPCGEQPLPPDGDCNLGAINLASLVRAPFTPEATFDYARLAEVARLGIRFLDRVLDVTQYPVPEQQQEAAAKRRLGLGIMGLGTALQMLDIRYGSAEAVRLTGEIMAGLRDACYRASVALAKEKGPFPLCDTRALGTRPFIQTLPADIQADIAAHGLRNGVLMTVAPTGTTAIFSGNVTGGLEPSFAWRYRRSIVQPDGSTLAYAVIDPGFALWCARAGLDPETVPLADLDLPDSMVTADSLTVEEHLAMQAVCQRYVDASISKTINCPETIPYDAFEQVYRHAYAMGCKGCTTYRPTPTRGAVLEAEPSPSAAAPADQSTSTLSGSTEPPSRPDALTGTTYKLKWPLSGENFYVTINDTEVLDPETGRVLGKRPFEMFIASRSAEHAELMSALTLTLSAILRRTPDPAFIVEDLEKVRGAQGSWVNGRYMHGVVPMIAGVLRRHLADQGRMDAGLPPRPYLQDETDKTPIDQTDDAAVSAALPLGSTCPQCQQPTLVRKEGCASCLSCGYSDCG